MIEGRGASSGDIIQMLVAEPENFVQDPAMWHCEAQTRKPAKCIKTDQRSHSRGFDSLEDTIVNLSPPAMIRGMTAVRTAA